MWSRQQLDCLNVFSDFLSLCEIIFLNDGCPILDHLLSAFRKPVVNQMTDQQFQPLIWGPFDSRTCLLPDECKTASSMVAPHHSKILGRMSRRNKCCGSHQGAAGAVPCKGSESTRFPVGRFIHPVGMCLLTSFSKAGCRSLPLSWPLIAQLPQQLHGAQKRNGPGYRYS